MQTQRTIGYEQIFNLAYNLPQNDKIRLIKALQNNFVNKTERKLGKYEGQGWLSDDFNDPLVEFKEYMP